MRNPEFSPDFFYSLFRFFLFNTYQPPDSLLYSDKGVLITMMTPAAKNSAQPEVDWTLDAVLSATGGSLVNAQTLFNSFYGVCTDTRSLAPGSLFVALNGDNFTGADFAVMAAAKGAFGIMVNRSELPLSLPGYNDRALISVGDTRRALGDLAAHRRRHMTRLRVIGITGSSGKTTVKEMTAAILTGQLNFIKTEGNFNNLIGLPLSLLPLSEEHRAAVLEMGMNRPGEIARLAQIAAPDISCIVNIQEAHLEGLKNIDGVADAKLELFDNSPASSTLIINLDDQFISTRSAHLPQQKITFSSSTPEDGRKADVWCSDFTESIDRGSSMAIHIGDRSRTITLQTIGRHNGVNALAAAAICHGMDLTFEQICDGLERFTPFEKRSQLIVLDNGIRVINDCYNANPSSMAAALDTLQRCRENRRTAAALGDMLELGDRSDELHRQLGIKASTCLDYLATIGTCGSTVVKAARTAGMDETRARHFSSHALLTDWINRLIKEEKLKEHDLLLIKGSRGMVMEKVLQKLEN